MSRLNPANEALRALKQDPPDVIGEISPQDTMFSVQPGSYFPLGKIALECIRIAMVAAEKHTVHSVLDLPSGYGRVLRMVKAEFPQARFTACDVDRDGVAFCASAFGATPVYSAEDPREIDGLEQYDLIYCYSLLTHLDRPAWTQFLDLFELCLAPKGLLVFTTHGRCIERRLSSPKFRETYLPKEEQRKKVLSGYGAEGFGFCPYVEDQSYGISLTSLAWVTSELERRPELQLVAFLEGRWGGQDVIGCIRPDERHLLGWS